MNEEKMFDYENYIQKRLKEIDDLDERKYAREILLDGLGRIFRQTEEKYEALEQRILRELDVPGKRFGTYMTIIEKKDFDPINSFWFPVCKEDIKGSRQQEYDSFYFMAEEEKRIDFFRQEMIEGIEEESGKSIRFQIRKVCRYEEAVKKLYALFANNHIPWQTVHMGHLERFFEAVPVEELSSGSRIHFQWGKWEEYVKTGMMPLWNIQKEAVNSREFRVPCIDEVFYEHIFYLPDDRAEEDGYLVEAKEDILSIRYERNRVLLKTKQDILQDVSVYRLHQETPVNSFGYGYAVLSNKRKDNLAGRYLYQAGNFLQTPMELRRKIEEMSGSYRIDNIDFEISEKAKSGYLTGDMNGFAGVQVFSSDKRSMLVFKFRKEEQQRADYLYESQIRYILSQLQMEFMEYQCVGVLV
ncbi:MAG: hypothetical protein J6C64_05150 [Lachnospiraceae bacterium]|nr:hypothetical protein [Lachnospiraceae bacterium]